MNDGWLDDRAQTIQMPSGQRGLTLMDYRRRFRAYVSVVDSVFPSGVSLTFVIFL